MAPLAACAITAECRTRARGSRRADHVQNVTGGLRVVDNTEDRRAEAGGCQLSDDCRAAVQRRWPVEEKAQLLARLRVRRARAMGGRGYSKTGHKPWLAAAAVLAWSAEAAPAAQHVHVARSVRARAATSRSVNTTRLATPSTRTSSRWAGTRATVTCSSAAASGMSRTSESPISASNLWPRALRPAEGARSSSHKPGGSPCYGCIPPCRGCLSPALEGSLLDLPQDERKSSPSFFMACRKRSLDAVNTAEPSVKPEMP
jgi:hypothetical protein